MRNKVQSEMTPLGLAGIVARLDATLPISGALEEALIQRGFMRPGWYSSQQEHWLGWLSEYDGQGC